MYMKEMVYDELSLESELKQQFGLVTDIRQMILCKAPVSPTATASLFLSDKKQLYLYISAKSKMNLGDVKKMVTRMGLKAELFLPPKGQPTYFEDMARIKFCEVFPGRKNINDEDLVFYRTLVSYNPALILISEVRDGHIYQYDSDSVSHWRIGANFAYRRIKTS